MTSPAIGEVGVPTADNRERVPKRGVVAGSAYQDVKLDISAIDELYAGCRNVRDVRRLYCDLSG